MGCSHVHQPALPPPLREGAPVREAADAQRRRQAQQAGDPQAARREVLPSQRRLRREGPPPLLRGRVRQAMAVPLLLLDQQPELRAHQGLEPLCQGEAPRRRRRRPLRAGARPRRRRPPLHRLQAPRRERAGGGHPRATRRSRPAACPQRRRAAVEPNVLQHVGLVVRPYQPCQFLRLPSLRRPRSQRHTTRRRVAERRRRQEQQRGVGAAAVEAAQAVWRQPRLRPGTGGRSGDGNVRLHAPPEPLRRSVHSAKLLGQLVDEMMRRSEAMLAES